MIVLKVVNHSKVCVPPPGQKNSCACQCIYGVTVKGFYLLLNSIAFRAFLHSSFDLLLNSIALRAFLPSSFDLLLNSIALRAFLHLSLDILETFSSTRLITGYINLNDKKGKILYMYFHSVIKVRYAFYLQVEISSDLIYCLVLSQFGVYSVP